MSEEALQEKEAAVGGDGLSPAASRAQMSTRSNISGHSGPTSTRSLACAAHRVSISSTSPPTSKRVLDVDGDNEVSSRVGLDGWFCAWVLMPAPCRRSQLATWMTCASPIPVSSLLEVLRSVLSHISLPT